jgi:hypothetical protein
MISWLASLGNIICSLAALLETLHFRISVHLPSTNTGLVAYLKFFPSVEITGYWHSSVDFHLL